MHDTDKTNPPMDPAQLSLVDDVPVYTPTQRPADTEIVNLVADHYNVQPITAIDWLVALVERLQK